MSDPDDLYSLPLERFTPERAALAKSLRADREPEEAKRVAKLRKPSVAAWAVNQLVRTKRRALTDLFKAGDELRAAHADLLAGTGDGRALAAASEQERAALDQLVESASGLLTSQGHELSSTTLERVRDTLHAAALDEDARAQVNDGCLVHELRHVGLGDLAPAQDTKPAPVRSARSTKRTDASDDESPSKRSRTRDDGARRAAEKAKRERAERERADRLRAARRAAADARRAADQTERALRAARQKRDRAAAGLENADAALAEARDRAEEAALAYRQAERALEHS